MKQLNSVRVDVAPFWSTVIPLGREPRWLFDVRQGPLLLAIVGVVLAAWKQSVIGAPKGHATGFALKFLALYAASLMLVGLIDCVRARRGCTLDGAGDSQGRLSVRGTRTQLSALARRLDCRAMPVVAKIGFSTRAQMVLLQMGGTLGPLAVVLDSPGVLAISLCAAITTIYLMERSAPARLIVSDGLLRFERADGGAFAEVHSIRLSQARIDIRLNESIAAIHENGRDLILDIGALQYPYTFAAALLREAGANVQVHVRSSAHGTVAE